MTENKQSEKVQYLQMIQSSISRMSTSSALFKGFSATIVAGISLISYKDQHLIVVALSFIPVVIFFVLDVYYLQLERRMRYLFDMVRVGVKDCDFCLKPPKIEDIPKGDINEWELSKWQCFCSHSIKWFYPTMLAILIIIIILKGKGII